MSETLRSRRVRYLAWLCVLVGLVLVPLPFWTGTSTLAACEFGGFYGAVYDAVGIYPPGYTVDIDWSDLQVVWSDGCNGHVSSLVPSLLGGTLSLVGVGTLAWRRR
ncbi:hypothetical protein [Natronomonas gomsonensis]|uniref:hypothetical protein n=1 Tax=Natronomonas gomsonensis TaxID=1046043 RepID=UPI0015B90DCC|nr:hypothetical protein [Natronomonas gomsonensis]